MNQVAIENPILNSPHSKLALIAEYHTQLPDKKLLQAKLHEFYVGSLSSASDL